MVYIIYAGSTKAKILIPTINLQQVPSIIREIVISIKEIYQREYHGSII